MRLFTIFAILWSIIGFNSVYAGVATKPQPVVKQVVTLSKIANQPVIQERVSPPKKFKIWQKLKPIVDPWLLEMHPATWVSVITGLLSAGGAATLLLATSSVASFIAPLFYGSIGLGVVALIAGFAAFMALRNHGHLLTGKGMTWIGILLGMGAVIVLLASMATLL